MEAQGTTKATQLGSLKADTSFIEVLLKETREKKERERKRGPPNKVTP